MLRTHFITMYLYERKIKMSMHASRKSSHKSDLKYDDEEFRNYTEMLHKSGS